MRKYRLSTKYRGERGALADHLSLSSINHYDGHHNQNGGTKLDHNLNKVYIRNFYEYHHRKRPGEGKTAKQEYDKQLREENKRQRLKELESQLSRSSSSFDSTEDDDLVDGQTVEQTNGPTNGHLNGQTNGYMNGNNQNGSTKKPETLTNGSGLQNGDLSKQRADGPPRRSTKKSGRTRAERSSKEFFDALLSNRKSVNFESEYKRCVQTNKELNQAKQIQAYQCETAKDNYDDLEDIYNELNHKFKFINRECKLIEKDIERLKADYCRLVKHDLIKKNDLIKENNYIPIYDQIPSIDLDPLGDLKNYERAYDWRSCSVDLEQYRKLNRLQRLAILDRSCDSLTNGELVDENNNRIEIAYDHERGKIKQGDQRTCEETKSEPPPQESEEKRKQKEQVEDLLYLLISRPDCTYFCDKIGELVAANQQFKSRIKRLQFEIANEKRKATIRKSGGTSGGVVEFEFSDNLEKQKPLDRHARHTINVTTPRASVNPGSLSRNRLCSNKSINRLDRLGGRSPNLGVFEIPTPKVELSQMKLKMQRKDLELKLCQSKKMKELVQSKLEMQKEALEESKRAEQKLLADQKQLTDEVKELKNREHQLKQENEKLKNYLRKATN